MGGLGRKVMVQGVRWLLLAGILILAVILILEGAVQRAPSQKLYSTQEVDARQKHSSPSRRVLVSSSCHNRGEIPGLTRPPGWVAVDSTNCSFRVDEKGELSRSKEGESECLDPSCTTLLLSGMGITSIAKDAFKGMKYLKYVHLGDNQISRITHEDVKDLAGLQFLSLMWNDIAFLLPGLFGGFSSLKHLELGYNPGTGTEQLLIEEGAFDGLIALEMLFLFGCRINLSAETGLHPVFRRLENLKYLDLENNMLREVGPATFEGLEGSLETLLLNRNQIASVANDVFAGFAKLKTIHLEDNPLVCRPHFSEPDVMHLDSMVDGSTGSCPSVTGTHDPVGGLLHTVTPPAETPPVASSLSIVLEWKLPTATFGSLPSSVVMDAVADVANVERKSVDFSSLQYQRRQDVTSVEVHLRIFVSPPLMIGRIRSRLTGAAMSEQFVLRGLPPVDEISITSSADATPPRQASFTPSGPCGRDFNFWEISDSVLCRIRPNAKAFFFAAAGLSMMYHAIISLIESHLFTSWP